MDGIKQAAKQVAHKQTNTHTHTNTNMAVFLPSAKNKRQHMGRTAPHASKLLKTTGDNNIRSHNAWAFSMCYVKLGLSANLLSLPLRARTLTDSRMHACMYVCVCAHTHTDTQYKHKCFRLVCCKLWAECQVWHTRALPSMLAPRLVFISVAASPRTH